MTDLPRKRLDIVELCGGFEQSATLTLGVDLWKLKEAVALTLGIDVWKLKDVLGLIELNNTKPSVYLSLNQAFLRRCEVLKRAAIKGDLPSRESNEEIWFTPDDFLFWYDRKSGWKDDFLSAPMKALLEEWRADSRTASNADTEKEKPRADSDSDANADAEKGKAPASSLGVSKAAKVEGGFSSLGELKDKKGVRETWALMCSELRKPLDKRQFRTMRKLREHCEDTFDIGFHDCVKVSTKAIQEPGSIRYKPGKLSKRKAS